MKKPYLYIMMSLLSVAFASCSQDNESEFVPVNREAVFSTHIVQTRTITEGKVTNFVADDQMGIFGIKRGATKVFNKNVLYTYTEEQKWTANPAITFPVTSEEVNFYAYYPSVETEGAIFDFSVLADQSADNGYAKSDLLMAKNTIARLGDTSIELQFAHSMAMIEVRPYSPTGSTVALQKVSLAAVRGAKVDLVNQTATVKAGEKAEEITLVKVADGVYRAVVPAQTLKAGRVLAFAGIDTATDLSVHQEYTLSAGKTVEANKITLFTIALSK